MSAYVGLMRVSRATGDPATLKRLLEAYRKRFPKGRRATEVERLAR